MGDNIEENIVINADGTAAVRSLNAVDTAFRGLAATHAQIKASFGQRFEHAGVFLFSRQLLGLAGLSDLARHAMGAISIGFEEVATTIGTSVTAMAPWLLAAGAAIIVFEKLTKGGDAYTKTLNEMKKAQESTVPGMGMAAAQAKIAADKELLSVALETQKAAAEQLHNFSQGSIMYERYAKAANAAALDVRVLTNDIAAQNAAMAKFKDAAEGGPAKRDQAEAEERLRNARARANNEMAAAMTRMRHDQLEYQINLDKMVQKQNHFAQVGKQAASGIGDAFGNAFAKMLVGGEDFTKNLAAAFQQMTEQILANIIKIEIEQQVMIALQTIYDILSGGSGMITGGPGSGDTAKFGPSANFKATGMDSYVDRPTAFVAGEAGPERVTVAPLGGGPQANGQGGGSQNYSINVTVSAAGVVTDLNAFASKVGQQIAQQVRGMGQNPLVRA